MDFEIRQGTLFCSGAIVETMDRAQFVTALAEAAQKGKEGRAHVNLSGINRLNSTGVKLFLEAIEQARIPMTLHECPEIFIVQFNLIDEFWDHDIEVQSFQARFYCVEEDMPILRMLVVGKDVSLKDEYLDEDIHVYHEDNKTFEPDFEPSYYFTFLKMQYQKPRKAG